MRGSATSTFVGRQSELSELAAGVEEAIDGNGRGFLVLGDPGVGKTRLATEVADLARGQGVLTLWGRCWEAGGAPPYWPWTEVLRGAAGRLDMPAPLHALLPGRVDPATVNDAAARFELFDAAGSYLRQVASEQPVLVVIDDLHAADLPSLLLLESLLGGALRHARVAIVALAREHEWGRSDDAAAAALRVRRLARVLRLEGLSRDEVAMLVEHRVDAPPPELVDAVNDATEGNPLFVEELTALIGTARSLPAGQPLPTGIRETIRQRLAPLSPDVLDTLSVGAVVGREFDMALVGAAAGGAEAGLDEAVRAGVLSCVDTGVYRFSHILVRDVLYDSLPPTRRAGLHERVGLALEQRHQAEVDDHLDALALHFVEAGDDTRAVDYLLRAGARAEARLAHERAVVHYERALSLIERDGDPAALCEALLALGRAYTRVGRGEAANGGFRRAADLARRLGDGARLARAAIGLAERVAFQQQDDAIVAVLEEALAGLGGDDLTLRARVLSALARVLGYVGQRERVEAVAREAVAAARGAGDDVLADALAAWQLVLWTPDRVVERLDAATELLAAAQRAGERERALEAHMARMICQLELGDGREFDRSLAAYERLAEELRQPRYRFIALTRRAMRAFMRGDVERGRQAADEARTLGNRCGEPDAEPVFHGVLALPARDGAADLAEVEQYFIDFSNRHTSAGSRALLASLALARGDVAAARRDLDAVVAVLDGLPKDMDWLLCLSLAGEVAAGLGDEAVAARLYPLLVPYADRCALIAGAVGFAGSVAHYLGLLAQALGRADDAERHFATALSVHVGLGAAPWVSRTERARGAPRRVSGQTVTLRRQGDGWRVGPFTLPDAKGLHHLAALLSRPGQEVHVLDLVGGGVVDSGGDAVLDDVAKEAYRRRIAELRSDVDEAEEWGDVERAARARAELEAVTDHLSASLGLGGRDRRAATSSDRARVSVRKAIVRAVSEIARHDPDLGRYLETTVKTGVFCSYEPDPRFAITWEL